MKEGRNYMKEGRKEGRNYMKEERKEGTIYEGGTLIVAAPPPLPLGVALSASSLGRVREKKEGSKEGQKEGTM